MNANMAWSDRAPLRWREPEAMGGAGALLELLPAHRAGPLSSLMRSMMDLLAPVAELETTEDLQAFFESTLQGYYVLSAAMTKVTGNKMGEVAEESHRLAATSLREVLEVPDCEPVMIPAMRLAAESLRWENGVPPIHEEAVDPFLRGCMNSQLLFGWCAAALAAIEESGKEPAEPVIVAILEGMREATESAEDLLMALLEAEMTDEQLVEMALMEEEMEVAEG